MTEFATATLTATTDLRGRRIPQKQQRQRRLKVHFNPEKLELTITNAMEQNRNRRRREPPQLVTETTAKLSLELLFEEMEAMRRFGPGRGGENCRKQQDGRREPHASPAS